MPKPKTCETSGVSDLGFKLTKDLTAALAEITGSEPVEAIPVVVLAAYVDALAKQYGLSESLNLDVDPMERTQQVRPVMETVHRYFQGDGLELDADSVRSQLYDAVAGLAADPRVRKFLNRNQPLTENTVLHLAQIYWNLEATPQRPKLPIKRTAGRDIPVPGILADFATMTWTARVNQKCSYKSSGQGFRTQGARLAVLLAQHLTTRTAPAPSSPARDLDVRPTGDPEEPLEITLKNLVKRAWEQGEYDDAVELSTSYLTITKRRADANPFDVEPDLAGAYLLKGFVSLRPIASWGRVSFDVGMDTTGDLEKAVSSFTMLSQLDPQNDEHSVELVDACLALCVVYAASDRLDDSLGPAQQAVSVAERLAGAQPDHAKRQKNVYLALMALSQPLRGAGRFDDAGAAMARAVAIAEGLTTAEPSEPGHEEFLVALLWGLSQDLRATGRFDDAVQAATRAVAISERSAVAQTTNQRRLASSLLGLSEALNDAGRFDEAVAVAERSVTIRESLVATEPSNAEFRADLAVMIFALGRLLRAAGRFEDVPAASTRAVEIFRQLAATEPEKLEYQRGLATSLDDLGRALRELGRFDEAQAVDEELGGG
jgi:tetratricopeptide (TPR) repeat protein